MMSTKTPISINLLRTKRKKEKNTRNFLKLPLYYQCFPNYQLCQSSPYKLSKNVNLPLNDKNTLHKIINFFLKKKSKITKTYKKAKKQKKNKNKNGFFFLACSFLIFNFIFSLFF